MSYWLVKSTENHGFLWLGPGIRCRYGISLLSAENEALRQQLGIQERFPLEMAGDGKMELSIVMEVA